ncbi:hypothetical protein HELRODRAFT_158789 [Helobdella robusta]|uniref:C2H2-type domain-containing protein n=1 Tax=Helobdella robusta TaxID=6412 RepID=T1EN96_HELRO|nr:hypothetical protein HELRODRAFT_158789 [Helobdella robusta]ESO12304.1 hypothetical protein HELRODRAFT_158789 [Helobdella robusta]
MDKDDMFKKLFNAFIKANPSGQKQKIQHDCVSFWNSIKTAPDFVRLYNAKKAELEGTTRKRLISSFFLSKNENIPSNLKSNDSSCGIINSCSSTFSAVPSTASCSKLTVSNDKCPAQKQLTEELNIINADLVGLMARDNMRILTAKQKEEMDTKKARKRQIEKDIIKKKANQERQKKFRIDKKEILQKVIEENPELAKKLKTKESPGCPSIVSEQSDLLKSILDIAEFGCSADERRRMETLRCVKTLDELHKELLNMGRHVSTVPVKLIRATNDLHRQHPDTKFATDTVHHLCEFASFFGPANTTVISQDDKCRVPIGITAAKMQAPMLMHMEYRVRLPDHDWVIGDRHKLIPSVYAGLVISEKGYGAKEAVTYSGPTFISIRSGKHSSSNAMSHARDFERLMKLSEFGTITKTMDQNAKPIFIFFVDGGPDENPRYPHTIQSAIGQFKKYNLDAIFIATNAPGRSAFNQVERRMAPLSRELSGVILLHDFYGSHLDINGKTIDEKLEILNFEHAVIAEYVCPERSEIDLIDTVCIDEKWKMNHIRSSQYFLQILKCQDRTCCTEPRSPFFNFFPQRFLPAPLPLVYSPSISIAKSTKDVGKFMSLFQNEAFANRTLPYDFHCPSVSSTVPTRVCIDCGLYCASLEMLKSHRKSIHNRIVNTKKKPKKIIKKRNEELLVQLDDDVEWMNRENVECIEETEEDENPVNNEVPIISIQTHLESIWEKDC